MFEPSWFDEERAACWKQEVRSFVSALFLPAQNISSASQIHATEALWQVKGQSVVVFPKNSERPGLERPESCPMPSHASLQKCVHSASRYRNIPCFHLSISQFHIRTIHTHSFTQAPSGTQADLSHPNRAAASAPASPSAHRAAP